jgi:hypothetical protein
MINAISDVNADLETAQQQTEPHAKGLFSRAATP